MKRTKIKSLEALLEAMWVDYCRINPAAIEIWNLLKSKGEVILNDHIALRTIQHPKLGISSLANVFKSFGYIERDEYFFKEKKLYAKYYQHPNLELPKVFISELELSKVSDFARKTLSNWAEQIPDSIVNALDFPIAGRLWELDLNTYRALAAESEYASWFAAFGFRPNHFTININALKIYDEVSKINELLKRHGHVLNNSGGEIKGTPAVFLEQSSTMAPMTKVQFKDGELMIPGCYYEFAKRYAMPDGTLYQGFVAASADKIFESTYQKAA